MMNFYKKTIMVAAVFAAVSFGGVVLAERCQSCAEKMAIKQSIKDALAAALALSPAAVREQELDTEIEKCGCSKPKPKPGRAAHGISSSIGCTSDATSCILSQQLQDLACANAACCKVVSRINDRVKEQGRDAKKCCHKVREDLEDIEELVVSVIDQSADCCSTTEALLVSVIDQSAVCCSTTEALLVSIMDQAAACCSTTESLLVSIIDQNMQIITSSSIADLVINEIFGCTCL